MLRKLWSRLVSTREATSEADLALADRLVAESRELRRLRREADAEIALRRALELDPTSVDAHAALFDLAQTRNDLAGSLVHLEGVLQQRPDWVDALSNYGALLVRAERLDEAETAFRRVLALNPGYERVYRMLTSLLHRRGRIAQLLEVCKAGRTHAGDGLEVESFELLALNFVDPADIDDLPERHRAFGRRLEAAVPERFLPFANLPDPDRKLRIGYVSGDFSLHPVSLFLLPLLERHDRSWFETYCYSVGSIEDDFTRRIRGACDQWREAKSLTADRLADVVHTDGIDLLLDLSGHSGVSRLRTFAQRPAPVQASWLGYLNTTGLTRIQYRISDGYADPPGRTGHPEAIVRLPHCQWCYRPMTTLPVASAPVRSNGQITFGVFTQIAKLTKPMLLLWSRILCEVPTARIVIAGIVERRMQAELQAIFAQRGVEVSRVTFRPFMPVHEYFASFSDVDIALDTSPYSGGTTTCDSLWMGVPVLTLPGSRPASRSAGSILSTLRLTDWIATSQDDYVQRAAAFAAQPETLAVLRGSLRERMRSSPLMQEELFARDMEKAYRFMWREWCSRGRP